MSKIIKKIKFFTIADYIEEEAWLTDQHKKGLKFTKIAFPGVYYFEKSNPEQVVYQLDYQNKPATSDYIKLFKDYGWEYCGSFFGWNYFRKIRSIIDEDGDEEIFSDAESKIEMLSSIYKTRTLPLIVIFFLLIIPNFMTSLVGDSVFYNISRYVFGLFFLLYIFVFIKCRLKLNRLKRDLEK